MRFEWDEPIRDIKESKAYKLMKAIRENNIVEAELLKEEIENGRTN
jgi:hypothetical protein